MPRSVEKSGKTIDEAVEDALAELGVSIDDVVIDVLDEGDNGILGIGRKPARVLVTYDEAALQPLTGGEDDLLEDGQYDYSPEALEKASIEDPGMLNNADFQDGLEDDSNDADVAYFGDDEASETDSEVEDLALKAIDYLEQIFAYMDIEATFSYSQDEGQLRIDVDGEDVGAAIGHRGETLNAIQYLSSLVVNRVSSEHVYLTVDVAGYRKRRERSLIDMAKRTAKRVIEVGKDFVMEPMTAAERRIIHTALQEYPGVHTESEGIEPKRSVVIIPDNRK